MISRDKKMKKILCLLVVLSFALPVWAGDNSSVVMNVKTYIYHDPNCRWAKKCTKNCVKTTKQKAQAQGARACKVCGG